MSVVVDGFGPDDAPFLLALNNLAIPEVNELTLDEFQQIRALGTIRVSRLPELPHAGFVLTMGPHAPYWSTNYVWFQERYGTFFYVDRVIVSAAARGRGVGRTLYEDTFAQARAAGFPRVASEVNTIPPNPGSMAFHAALGFTAVGERVNEASGKSVAMMVCELG